MKYCPYCGTVLVDGAVSFCAECGKALPVSEKSNQSEQQGKSKRQETQHEKKSRRRQKGKILHGETVKKREEDKTDEQQIKPLEAPKSQKQQPEPSAALADSIPEDDYDGYYDDILPADEGRFSEGIDRGLVKKIVLIIGMVLLIVGACVMMMYLL